MFTALARSALQAAPELQTRPAPSLQDDNVPLPFQGVASGEAPKGMPAVEDPPAAEVPAPAPLTSEPTGPVAAEPAGAPASPAAKVQPPSAAEPAGGSAAPTSTERAGGQQGAGNPAVQVARAPRPRPSLPAQDATVALDPAAAAGPRGKEASAPAASQSVAPSPDAVPPGTGEAQHASATSGSSPSDPSSESHPTAAEKAAAAAALRSALASGAEPALGPPPLPAPSAPPPRPAGAGVAGVHAEAAHCLTVGEVADQDGDFKRNAALLSTPGFCIAQDRFDERRRPWIVQSVDSGRPGPLWVVPHDDEDVAFDSAVYGLTTYGGVLFTVETGGKRNQDGIDPNRNFADAATSCPQLGKAASPRYTAALARFLEPGRRIIALHNIFHGPVETNGLGHISMDAVPQEMRQARARPPNSALAGTKALVLLAAADPVDAAAEKRMTALSGKGVNVVLEPVHKGGDCSLADYAVLTGRADYANVTVNWDEGAKQRKIIDVLMAASPTVAASR